MLRRLLLSLLVVLNLSASGQIIDSYRFAAPTLLSDLTDDSPFLFDAANIKTMAQETTVGEVTTEATADGQSVGTWYSKGFGGLLLSTVSNTNRPTLESGGGFNSYIKWGASSVVLTNTSALMKAYVSPFHGLSGVYSMLIWLKIDTDGTTKQIIATSSTGLTTVAGIRFLQLSTGALTLRISNGTGTILNFTTTGTITSASGWVPIIITQNGNGTNTFSVYIGNAAAETASPTAGINGVSANQGLVVGAPGLSIGRIQVLNYVVTSQERTDFRALNPARNTDMWASLAREFDMQSSCYSDVTWTTPSVDGGQIRGWKNLTVSPFGSIDLFNGTTASGAASPIWESNSTGGRGAAIFDGSGTPLVTFGTDLLPDGHYASFTPTVFQNLDVDHGSHIISSSPQYWVIVGPNYEGSPDPDYQVVHLSTGGGGTTTGQDLTHQSNQANVNAFFRYVDTAGTLTTNGGEVTNTAEGLSGSMISLTTFGGTSQGADWYPDGPLSYYAVWRGYFSTPYRTTEVARLKTLFGL